MVVRALVFQGFNLCLRGSDVGVDFLGAKHHCVVDMQLGLAAHAGVGC